MTTVFHSWHDFFAMGGYALYVWLSVAVTLITLSLLIGHSLWQRRALLKAIRQQQVRQQRVRMARLRQHARNACEDL